MLLLSLVATALVATASTTKLYVSSYAGTITTLNLEHNNGTYSLTKLFSNTGCQANASWIRMDAPNHNLYCVDEGTVTGYGTLNSFKINEETGNLTKVNRAKTAAAPVNSVMYTSPNGTQLLAVAHYTSTLTTWRLDTASAQFTLSQNISLNITHPGPKADRQAASHPHQVLVDPQNKYFVIPDLGADLVRIYYIDPKTLQITARPSIPVVPGSGPRHGRFHNTGKNSTHYYLVTELGNTLTGYKTTYLPQNGGLSLQPIMNSTTYGPANGTTFAGNAASEVYISQAGEELIVSNRNASFFDLANPDPKNATHIKSDTLATFPLSSDGKFSFGKLSPAGGSFPRHFAENQDGSLLAVGLQNTERVVIYRGSKGSGALGTDILASFTGLGAVTSVVWGN
ncbi:hypothetical protein ACLMJK_003150 [Lecanora helva]